LTPQTSLLWSIQSADGQPLSRMNGESIVGPDGRIEVGPYGAVAVAGLTLAQAETALEKHLARYLAQPRVSLQPAGAAAPFPEPAPLATIGRVVPLGDPPRSPTPGIIATSAQQVEPVPPADVPQRNELPVTAPAETDVAAPSSDWKPVATAPGTEPAPAGNWRPLARDSAAAAVPVQSTGWRPMPQGPAGDPSGHLVQAEPPTELKVPPRPLPSGRVEPGPMLHGALVMDGAPPSPPVPHEQARVLLPPYVIDPPDVLLVESTEKLPDQPIRGQHLVRPDGTIGLGIYGSVRVAGMTLDQAKQAIAQQLASRIALFKNDPEAALKVLSVDVLAYNSKFYYVITDGGGYGEQVTRFPITGNETVLDAISQIGGLHAVASRKHIWLARTTGGHPGMQTYPVDWCGITQRGDVSTNYQVMPNDRIYVKAKGLVTFDTALARVLSPIERIFGVTLLGSTTVNSISGRGLGFGNR
jgi:polysaccharide export outer membrane protein